VLFDPARHEALGGERWDEWRARRHIETIVGETEAAFDRRRFWPAHPGDFERAAPERMSSLYLGAAGVILALAALERGGFARLASDWTALARELATTPAAAPDLAHGRPGLLLGRSGLLFAAFRLEPAEDRAKALLDCIAANHAAAEDELMWGAPGTLSLALAMHGLTGEERWIAAFREGAGPLLERWREPEGAGCRLWRQHLYGSQAYLLGAAHGLVGTLAPLLAGRARLAPASQAEILRESARSVAATAQRADALANWPQSVLQHRPGRSDLLVQICHGAPGVICALRDFPIGADPELEGLLWAGGELTWQAGPLAKGAGLCHGTAGNGYAFLELHRRSGDARWLERARAFAMHAIGQSARERERVGRLRFTLWTGDLGLALYLADCLRGEGGFPTLTAW
jgi:hypothetical protein